MLKKTSRSKSSIEEVVDFYNKYWAYENDRVYIVNLLKQLAKVFITKVNNQSDTLKFTENDLNDISNANMIQFNEHMIVKVSHDSLLFLDKYANIISYQGSDDLKEHIGKNIFQVLPVHNLDNDSKCNVEFMILQNILVSKIYKATRDIIKINIGPNGYNLFTDTNKEILEYEDNLNEKNNSLKQISDAFTRVRSNR